MFMFRGVWCRIMLFANFRLEIEMYEDYSEPKTPTGVWIEKDDVNWDVNDDHTILAAFRDGGLIGWLSGREAQKLRWTHALRLPDSVV